jgi:hypothetical protein
MAYLDLERLLVELGAGIFKGICPASNATE